MNHKMINGGETVGALIVLAKTGHLKLERGSREALCYMYEHCGTIPDPLTRLTPEFVMQLVERLRLMAENTGKIPQYDHWCVSQGYPISDAADFLINLVTWNEFLGLLTTYFKTISEADVSLLKREVSKMAEEETRLMSCTLVQMLDAVETRFRTSNLRKNAGGKRIIALIEKLAFLDDYSSVNE